ncbi:MAG TPA: hypothetical protein VGF51_11510 [Acidimicrobiales bacterium]|jgi:hypothetical protein
MGDYVLESNPALGRLIERLGAEGKRPGPEKSSSLHDSKRFQRRGRSKIPKRTRENLTTLDTQTRAEVASLVEPTSLVEELVVEDDLEAIHEDPQAADEIVLIDFDEEPAVFAEDPGDAECRLESDEADEILDVYGRTDLDDIGESADEDLEAFDEMGMLLEADQEDDGVSVQTVSGVDDAAGDWIFDAFKAWMLEVDQAVA